MKYVYLFKEGNAKMRNLLGGKGANLAEMCRLGLPVPQGFTVSTEACSLYMQTKTLSEEVKKQILNSLQQIEKLSGKKFGDENNPLLLSVRSGARISMPGMLDTVLNLGLNDQIVKGFAQQTGKETFAYDCYRRFIQMYGNVVKGINDSLFEKEIDKIKKANKIKLDSELTLANLKELIKNFKAVYKQQTKEVFPQDVKKLLMNCVESVFMSWDNERAKIYRSIHNIPQEWGTAVNVQTMVFGNFNEQSGTGVCFSRDPATGENVFYGEYLMNAQGEDIVAGVRTPLHISNLKLENKKIYNELYGYAKKLEKVYKDMQDMEFTVEDGKLYFLQTRSGKRTAQAALKVACDLVDEGLITPAEAVCRVEPNALNTLLHPSFDPAVLKTVTPIGTGLPASPGAGTGHLSFDAADAKARKANGEKVLLVRAETSPEDIEGMVACEGILTMRGGMTSHAAVVARGMGKCCITGCGEAKIDEEAKTVTLNGKVYGEGDTLSIDGTTGLVYEGAIPTVEAELTGYFGRIMDWADEYRDLRVRANADTPRDAIQAAKFGAQGIGLCRTEHMFFDADRIFNMRKMILSDTVEAREAALALLLPYQRDDFYKLYMAMGGLNVNVRLLDPPLHEFLPQDEEMIRELAKSLNISVETIKDRINSLHEFNPMMGHRGCRLDVSYPEIGRMQARAIIEAALLAQKDLGKELTAEIMIPLTLDVKEFKYVKSIIVEEIEKVLAEQGTTIKYHVGTMIEIPRAALLSSEIAPEAKFYSFGTNDLTQMTYGFSRDDAGKFLPDYYGKKIFEQDPFATVDQRGVGKLIKMAVNEGREANPDLHIGVCGEHGGDPVSIEFFHKAGLDYVSCSPFRVPVARLAAAQAAIKFPRKK